MKTFNHLLKLPGAIFLLIVAMATSLSAEPRDLQSGETNPSPALESPNLPKIEKSPVNHRIISQLRPDQLVAIICVLAVFGAPVFIVGITFYFRSRKAKLLHETLRLMIEKGVAIPPDFLKLSEPVRPPRPRNDLSSGLVLIAVGLGLMAMFATNHKGAWSIGLIPFLMGIAFLVVWKVEQNKPAQPEK